MKYLVEAEVKIEFQNKKEMDAFAKNIVRLLTVSVLKKGVWHRKQWRHLINPKGIIF